MTSSLLSLRSRLTSSTLPQKRLHTQAFRDYTSSTPKDEPVSPLKFPNNKEYIFREKKTKALRDYDRALLGFRFADALDLVMAGVIPFYSLIFKG